MIVMEQKEFFTQTPEGKRRIVYYQYGKSGNPVVFCVHGLARFGRDFEFIGQALSDNFCVIAPDMLGRGGSDRMHDSKNYSYKQYIADSIGIIHAHGAEKVHWLGTSMGGTIGMMVASQFPELIETLMLNDIGAFIPKSASEYIVTRLPYNPVHPDWNDFYELFKKRLKTFGIRKEEHMRFLAEISALSHDGGGVSLNFDTGVIDGAINHFGGVVNILLWDLWENIHCPTLLIRGENSYFLSPETAEEMTKTGSKAKLVTIPDCGHTPALADEYQIGIIIDWLNDNNTL